MQQEVIKLVRCHLANGENNPEGGQESYEIDEAIADYIAHLIEESEDDIDQIVGYITSFAPHLSEKQANRTVKAVRKLLRRLAKGDTHSTVPGVPTQLCTGGEEFGHLTDLMELAPQLSYQSLETIFRDMFLGDKERAAEYIVRHYCTGEMYTPMQVDSTIRQHIAQKFADQEILPPKSPSKKPPKINLRVSPPKKEGLVRYYENKVVTTKGQKFIEEKKVEYDGGSRGRVKTKGKRGRWVE